MSSPATILAALAATAARGDGEYVFHLDDGPVRLSAAELLERAQGRAGQLIASGVEPGDAVGLLGPNAPEWVVWAFATWLAGAALVPVQIPIRVRDPDAFAAQLRRLVAAAACRRVVADPRLLAVLPAGVGMDWAGGGDVSGEAPAPPAPGDAAVIQFTSGSTSFPKGALLTHAAVMAQMRMIRPAYVDAAGSPRVTLSWTPFFHDLGLVSNVILPAVWGTASQHLPTERFAREPALWLRLVEATRASLTVGPSSAFGSALGAARRRGERPDLGSLEVAYFAAEGVDPEVARRMAGSAGELGLRPEALGSTYGMAEVVMAAAYPHTGSGMRIERVSLDRLTAERVAAPSDEGRSRLLVSCGPPRMDLRIVGPAGEDLPERHVGEILLRGESMTSGYVGASDDPFDDGWLRSGDLGYLAGGELYVAGRAKDMVIAMGHNYYPEDFEWAAGRVAGVRAGRCVAFAMTDAERVVVVVEPEDPDADSAALRRAVARSIADAIGVRAGEVVVVPRGTVEKTTSGKLRRAAMREAYAAGEKIAASGSAAG